MMFFSRGAGRSKTVLMMTRGDVDVVERPVGVLFSVDLEGRSSGRSAGHASAEQSSSLSLSVTSQVAPGLTLSMLGVCTGYWYMSVVLYLTFCVCIAITFSKGSFTDSLSTWREKKLLSVVYKIYTVPLAIL